MYQWASEDTRPSIDENGKPIRIGDRPYLQSDLKPTKQSGPGYYPETPVGETPVETEAPPPTIPKPEQPSTLYTSPQQMQMSQAAENTDSKDDLYWWTKKKDYTDWLTGRGYDPMTLDSHTGNMLFKDYVEEKAKGTNSPLDFIFTALGSAVNEVSGIVNSIPVVGKITSKVLGSTFKFIGNFLDLPRNILAGSVAAIGSGHLEEWAGNMGKVLASGISGGEWGDTFSYSDFAIRKEMDNLQKSMSPDQYQEYVKSDEWRATRRQLQTGGLVADLVLDPMWILAAAKTKAITEIERIAPIAADIKKLFQEQDLLGKIVGKVFPEEYSRSMFGDIAEGSRKELLSKQLLESQKAMSNSEILFRDRWEKLIPHLENDKKLYEVLDMVKTEGMSPLERYTSIIDNMKNITESGSGLLDPWGYRLRAYKTIFEKGRWESLPLSPSADKALRTFLPTRYAKKTMYLYRKMHESIPSIMLSKDLIDPDSVFNYAATHWDHFVDVVKKNMEESGVPMTADKANEVLTSIMESNYGFRPTYAVRDASLKQLNLPNYAAEAADIKKKWYKASTKYTPDSMVSSKVDGIWYRNMRVEDTYLDDLDGHAHIITTNGEGSKMDLDLEKLKVTKQSKPVIDLRTTSVVTPESTIPIPPAPQAGVVEKVSLEPKVTILRVPGTTDAAILPSELPSIDIKLRQEVPPPPGFREFLKRTEEKYPTQIKNLDVDTFLEDYEKQASEWKRKRDLIEKKFGPAPVEEINKVVNPEYTKWIEGKTKLYDRLGSMPSQESVLSKILESKKIGTKKDIGEIFESVKREYAIKKAEFLDKQASELTGLVGKEQGVLPEVVKENFERGQEYKPYEKQLNKELDYEPGDIEQDRLISRKKYVDGILSNESPKPMEIQDNIPVVVPSSPSDPANPADIKMREFYRNRILNGDAVPLEAKTVYGLIIPGDYVEDLRRGLYVSNVDFPMLDEWEEALRRLQSTGVKLTPDQVIHYKVENKVVRETMRQIREEMASISETKKKFTSPNLEAGIKSRQAEITAMDAANVDPMELKAKQKELEIFIHDWKANSRNAIRDFADRYPRLKISYMKLDSRLNDVKNSIKSFELEYGEWMNVPTEDGMKYVEEKVWPFDKKILASIMDDPEIQQFKKRWMADTRKYYDMNKVANLKMINKLGDLNIFTEAQKNIMKRPDMIEEYSRLRTMNPQLTENEFIAAEISKRYTPLWFHETMSYSLHRTTAEFRAFAGSIQTTTDQLERFIDSTSQFAHRGLLVPTDFSNKKFLEILYRNDKKALTRFQNITGMKLEDFDPRKLEKPGDLWQDTRQYMIELQNSNDSRINTLYELNMDGYSALPTERRLIDYLTIQKANDLSERGLLFYDKMGKPFVGRVFMEGQTPFNQKIMEMYEKMGRTESLMGIFGAGQTEGWLKPIVAGENMAEPAAWLGVHKWKQGTGLFARFLIPEPMVKPLEIFQKGVFEFVDGPAPMKGGYTKWQFAGDAMKKFNKWWVIQSYIKHPSAHGRNFITNVIMALGEGQGIKFWDDDTKVGLMMNNYKFRLSQSARANYLFNNKLIDEVQLTKMLKKYDVYEYGKRMIKLGGEVGEVPVSQGYELALKYGIDSGFVGSVMDLHPDKQILEKEAQKDLLHIKEVTNKINPRLRHVFEECNFMGTKDVLTRYGGYYGQLIENGLGRFRMWPYLMREHGMSVEAAAKHINETFVDYSKMSKYERPIKQYLMPFYIWQTRMPSVMLKKAIEQPVFFTKLAQLQNDMGKMLEVDRRFAPQYESTSEGLPWVTPTDWGKFIKGKALGDDVPVKFIAMESFFPQASVNIVDIGNPARLFKTPIESLLKILGSVPEFAFKQGTPIIKLPLELQQNYSYFYKRPIEQYPGETSRFLGMDLPAKSQYVLKHVAGILKEVDQVVSTFQPNPYSGKPYHIADFILGAVTGFKAQYRDEVPRVREVMQELNEMYIRNASDFKNKLYDRPAAEKHAVKALSAYYGYKILEFYRDWLQEQRDSVRFKMMKEQQAKQKIQKKADTIEMKKENFLRRQDYQEKNLSL